MNAKPAVDLINKLGRPEAIILCLGCLLLISGCTNSATECLADAARDGKTRYQLGAIDADCKRKYPMVDGPFVLFGPKSKFSYEGQCYKVRVSDDFANKSTYSKQNYLFDWLSRQGKKSKRKHRC
jgi:hypothetical protein